MLIFHRDRSFAVPWKVPRTVAGRPMSSWTLYCRHRFSHHTPADCEDRVFLKLPDDDGEDGSRSYRVPALKGNFRPVGDGCRFMQPSGSANMRATPSHTY